MHVVHLLLHDYRSYAEVDVSLEPGVTAFVGPNGHGKTNLVEAIEYVATLDSHRVATDVPLVRMGAERAVVRVDVVRADRHALGEIEILPGKGNRARLNKSPLPKPREILGLLRVVLFSPDDLALVKGDPSGRRRFLDDLLVARAPRFAGVRQDYDRVLKQRNSLLKTAGSARHFGEGSSALPTLEVWDSHLASAGAELVTARAALVDELRPYVARAYARVAHRTEDDTTAQISYQPSFPLPDEPATREAAEAALLAEIAARRDDELARSVSLVGPHRDDLTLSLGPLPVRGYASHGESWSFALALRLASFDLLRADGDDPVLILDDVFAELDTDRRKQLAELVADAEQVLVTIAVPEDLPDALDGARFDVTEGEVNRVR